MMKTVLRDLKGSEEKMLHRADGPGVLCACENAAKMIRRLALFMGCVYDCVTKQRSKGIAQKRMFLGGYRPRNICFTPGGYGKILCFPVLDVAHCSAWCWVGCCGA